MRHWIPIVLLGFISSIEQINSLDETGKSRHLRARQNKTEAVGGINNEDELVRAWDLAFGSNSNNITPYKTTLSGQKKAKRNNKNKNGASCPTCSKNNVKQNVNANRKNKPTKKTPSNAKKQPRSTTKPTNRPTKNLGNSANKSKPATKPTVPTKPTKPANNKTQSNSKNKNAQGKRGKGRGGRPMTNSNGAGRKGKNGQGGLKRKSPQQKTLNKTGRAGSGGGNSVKGLKNLRAAIVEGVRSREKQSLNTP